MKNYAIILASGSSKRFGENTPKQFIEINGKTILERSIEAFEINNNITDIILICHPEYINLAKNILKDKTKKLKVITSGGKTRQESSYIGVSLVNDNDANILIHDCARPFVSQKIINECIDALNKFDAVGVGVNSTDTIVKIDENGFITEIPQRSLLRRIQTPQCFKSNIIKKAHEKAKNDKSLIVTDDCGMVLHYNLAKIAIIQGDEENSKITYKSDLK